MSKIDSPIDQIVTTHTESPSNHIAEILMFVASSIIPGVGFVNALKQFFKNEAVKERIESLLKEIMNVVKNLGADIDEIEQRMESQAFIETLVYAIERTIRINNKEKIKRFASVLGYNLTHIKNEEEWENVGNFIRTLDEISEADLKVLKNYSEILPWISSPNKKGLWSPGIDKNWLYKQNQDARERLWSEKMSDDEIHHRLLKLSGYGLMAEVVKELVPINTSDSDSSYPFNRRMTEINLFRPTEIGDNLVEMLKPPKTSVDKK